MSHGQGFEGHPVAVEDRDIQTRPPRRGEWGEPTPGGEGRSRQSADQFIEATQWTGIEQRPRHEDAEDQEQAEDNEHEGDGQDLHGSTSPSVQAALCRWLERGQRELGAAVLELRAPELEAPAPRRPYLFGLVSFISCFSLWRFSTLPSGATLT
jgi:hypothetical protein